jgi:serine/threonine-protein kinase
MDARDLELARTIEARIVDMSGDVDVARTLVNSPRSTIEPHRHASSGGKHALEALRALGASLEGKLSIHETLGEGGMGVVHLATQATLGRHVALKTLRAGAGDIDATLRILREAWVTGALEHPNVVPVYDVGVDASGSPVIVMKRIEGRDWGDLMHEPDEIMRRFSASDRLDWNIKILASVCNAVHFAHSRGILHRDLKPENVMIGAFGEVYVLDWGIAISLKDDPSGRLPPASLATDVAGTPGYMAPEMLLGDPSMLSPRTDVYLLGAIFYEIFAGGPPHEGKNLESMIASILLSKLKFPTGFPAEAQRICRKAMHRDPEERYESADAFRVAVDEYVRHRGSRKLAWDAKQSLNLLLQTLEQEERGEDRTLAVFNRLGECRFGYRAALSAWPENEAARKGLDRALLAVVDHELAEGDPNAAATLLREVSAPPADVTARVEAAIRARAEQDERLKRLEGDLDPTVGTRTRSFIGLIFGVLWTVTPLVGWCLVLRGAKATHLHTIVMSAAFLLVGFGAYRWARETLSKTLLNRRLAQTLGLHLCAQMLLGAGAWLGGISPETSQLLHIFTWTMTLTLLSVWVEAWFALPASVSALSFLVASAFPSLMYPLMSFDNLVLTLVLLRVWFPRQDILRIHERRNELRQRARKWLEDAGRGTRGEEE